MIADGRFALLRTTLLDFPGRVSASVFLPGCHLRCPYCHNPELVDPDSIRNAAERPMDISPLNCSRELLEQFLEKRARRLGGLVISGGEALLHPLLEHIIYMAAGFRLPVKLDTAGLLPDRLEALLQDRPGSITYAAVDLKTDPARYGELGWTGSPDSAAELLNRTMDVLESRGIDYELRTTVVPPLVDRDILVGLGGMAARAPRWIWQPYHPGNTLDSEWAALESPDEEKLNRWAAEFKKNSGAAKTPLIKVR